MNSGPLEQEKLYISKLDEVTVTIKNVHLQHWLFKDVKRTFIMQNRNLWDPHPVNLTTMGSVARNYTVLAESERGPQAIEHDNTIASQFHVHPNYPIALVILKNFVEKWLRDIQIQEKIGSDLDTANKNEKGRTFTHHLMKSINQGERSTQNKLNRPKSQISNILYIIYIAFPRKKEEGGKAETPMGGSKEEFDFSSSERREVGNEGSGSPPKRRPKTAMGVGKEMDSHRFAHSGWSYSKRRGIVIVENNAGHRSNIKPTRKSKEYGYTPSGKLMKISPSQVPTRTASREKLIRPHTALLTKTQASAPNLPKMGMSVLEETSIDMSGLSYLNSGDVSKTQKNIYTKNLQPSGSSQQYIRSSLATSVLSLHTPTPNSKYPDFHTIDIPGYNVGELPKPIPGLLSGKPPTGFKTTNNNYSQDMINMASKAGLTGIAGAKRGNLSQTTAPKKSSTSQIQYRNSMRHSLTQKPKQPQGKIYIYIYR